VRCQSIRQTIRWKAQYGPESIHFNYQTVKGSGRIAVRAGLATQLTEQHRTAAREDRKEIPLLAWGRRGRSTRKGIAKITKAIPRSGYTDIL